MDVYLASYDRLLRQEVSLVKRETYFVFEFERLTFHARRFTNDVAQTVSCRSDAQCRFADGRRTAMDAGWTEVLVGVSIETLRETFYNEHICDSTRLARILHDSS